jgi:hypothetical protein
MTPLETLRNRVHVILARHFGSIEITQDDEFVLKNESAYVFISVDYGFGSTGMIVKINCPILNRVPLSIDVYRWVSVEGRNFPLGGIALIPHANGSHGELWFGHSFSADELDEKELLGSVYPILVTANDLDDQLLMRFGGQLFVR